MDILEKIAAGKRKEVLLKKEIIPMEAWELLPSFQRKCLSLSKRLNQNHSGIIAEFKRKSPSISNINLEADIQKIPLEYENAGASGISILTDEEHFGGSSDDLLIARENVKIPILRKDFIIDEYQIFESKALGADVILLIAALLSKNEVKKYAETAEKLGLEVLFEVHNEQELKKISSNIKMVGVNNRNLKTFKVDINTSKKLAKLIPAEIIKVSESGINSIENIMELKNEGFKGFLLGEYFMKTEDPGKTAAQFIQKLS